MAGGLQDLVRAINHGLSGQTAYAIYQQLMAAQGGGGGGYGGGTTTTPSGPIALDAEDRAAIDERIAEWRASGAMPNSLHAGRMDLMTQLREAGTSPELLDAVYKYYGEAWVKAGGAPLPRDRAATTPTSSSSSSGGVSGPPTQWQPKSDISNFPDSNLWFR